MLIERKEERKIWKQENTIFNENVIRLLNTIAQNTSKSGDSSKSTETNEISNIARVSINIHLIYYRPCYLDVFHTISPEIHQTLYSSAVSRCR